MPATNGLSCITIDGQLGMTFSVEASSNLNSWATLFTATPTALPFTWVDPDGASFNARFYRVSSRP